MAAKRAAARARADAAAADALVAEALFADAQTTGGLSRDSPYARVLAEDAARVKDRLDEARFVDVLSDDGIVEDSVSGHDGSERQQHRQQQQQLLQPRALAGARRPPVGARRDDDVGSAAAAAAIPLAPVPAARKLTPRDPEENTTTPWGAASQPPGVRHTGERGAREVLPPEPSRSTAADAMEDYVKEEDGAGEGVSGVDEPASEEERHRQRWSSMKVVSLKEELRSRGLKVSGKKAELVERLLRA